MLFETLQKAHGNAFFVSLAHSQRPLELLSDIELLMQNKVLIGVYDSYYHQLPSRKLTVMETLLKSAFNVIWSV